MTNLAKRSALGLRFSTLVRATVVLALALIGLTNGYEAQAAPPAGAAPPENPFSKGADDEAPASDDEGTPEPAETPSGETGQGEDEGETPAAEGEETESESALHGLACLEGDATGGRRKGVQRRDFLKRHRFEIAAVGGFYASDVLSSTYDYGGALAFYPSEDFGVELLVTRSPIRFRLEEPFTAFDLEHHFQPSIAWQGIFSLLWSPIHAKFKFTDATIIHGDIFAVAGAGRTFHESVLGLTWEAGVGLKLYFSRFVSFRLDLRDFLLPQEVLGIGRTTNNVTILGGFSLWLG
jgi:outer membrane beta-barrel protein